MAAIDAKLATKPAIVAVTYRLSGLVGLLYFGYPASVPKAQPRKPLWEVMRRLA
jgi:hypothetical protein